MADAVPLEAFAAVLDDPDRAPPAGLVARNGADVARRLDVYRNNVAVGFVDALSSGFPVTERIVGTAFFRAMARSFAAEHKPASPLMFEYGAAFPGFVAGFPPARPVPYLADVARLEAARTRAYHAADARALDPAGMAERLADRPGAAILEARVRPHPAAGLVASGWPVASLWLAHDIAQGPCFGGPWRPETALVTRPEDDVRVSAMSVAEGLFASALLAGATVGGAGAVALAEDGGFEAGAVLVALVEAGAIADIKGEGS